MTAKRNSYELYTLILVGIFLLILSGCARERPSERTPIHLNPNMDNQEKYQPQEPSEFYADGAAQRVPVPGTIARGYLRDDDAFYRGLNSRGELLEKAPVEVDIHFLERGRDRFDIFCSPCHSRVGDGHGILVQRGYPPPPSFHEQRIKDVSDGHIFNVITNGLRNMPSYKHQIPPEDRWAIIVYLRALQRSQDATVEDVPEEMREKLLEVK